MSILKFIPLPLIAVSESGLYATENIINVITYLDYDIMTDTEDGITLSSSKDHEDEIMHIYSLLPIAKSIIAEYLQLVLNFAKDRDDRETLIERKDKVWGFSEEMLDFMDKYNGVERRYVSALRKLPSAQIQSNIKTYNFMPDDHADALRHLTFINWHYGDDMGFNMLKTDTRLYNQFDTLSLMIVAKAMQDEINNMRPLVNLIKESEGQPLISPPTDIMFLCELQKLLPSRIETRVEINNRVTYKDKDKDNVIFDQHDTIMSIADFAKLGIIHTAPVMVIP